MTELWSLFLCALVFLNVELWLLVSRLAFGSVHERGLSLLDKAGDLINHFFLGVSQRIGRRG